MCTKHKKMEYSVDSYLPDEIILNILYRLPPKEVLRCRSVCSRWKNLTSVQDRSFVESNLKFAVPTIIAEDLSDSLRHRPFLLDKWWEPCSSNGSKTIQEFGPSKYRIHFDDLQTPVTKYRSFAKRYAIMFSHHGLLVVEQKYREHRKCKTSYVIFNPINGGNVCVNILPDLHRADLYGVFFDPDSKHYCTLWAIAVTENSFWSERVEYRVLNLGSKPCWRNIRDPPNKNVRIQCVAPIFVDSKLYWLVESAVENRQYRSSNWDQDTRLYRTSNWDQDALTLQHLGIMEFDFSKYEWQMMTCPTPVVIGSHGCNTHLLNIEGCLSLVQLIRDGELVVNVHIWTLKDRVGPFWETSHYRINPDLNPKIFTFVEDAFLKAICVSNGELAIQSFRSLMIYNLRTGTVRIMKDNRQRYDVLCFSHLMSFESLKECKSNIYMDEEGEVHEHQTKCPLHNSVKQIFDLRFSIRKALGNEVDGGVDKR